MMFQHGRFRLYFDGDDGGGSGGDAAAEAAAGIAAADDHAGKDDDGWKPLTEAEQRKLQRQHDDAQAKLRQRDTADKEAKRKAAEKAGEHAKLADDERARADRLVGKIKASALTSAARDLAGQDGTRFANPALALRLVDLSGIDVDYNDDEAEATVPKAAEKEIAARLRAILKESPELAAKQDAGRPGGRQLPGAGGQAGGGKTTAGRDAMNDAIRARR